METYKHSSYEFHVVRKIGGGGFGEVFEVSLSTCSFKYALKKFSPQTEIAQASYLSEGELLARFSQETQYQTMCRHKNIVSICVIHSGQAPFFVMDLADDDLENLIRNNSLSKEDKIKVILDIINGLEYLHEKDWLHRDIKPANVLLFDGIYKISDFGLIKNLSTTNNSDDVMTAIGICQGTKKYMAPEVLTAANYSILSDIYALGVIMSELQIHELDSIANKCTNYTPSTRYQNVAEIRHEILRTKK